jgi:large subunit ribosomal protein L17
VESAKKNNLATGRLLRKNLTASTVKKLVSELGPRYQGRKGGYTRITRMAARKRDGAPMAVIELV